MQDTIYNQKTAEPFYKLKEALTQPYVISANLNTGAKSD